MNEVVSDTPVIIGRQPIFDTNNQVYAYELLFRSSENRSTANVGPFDGDLATSRVLNHTFLELGVERVIGKHLAFVNLTRNYILSDDPLPFEHNKVVLEVLEDIEVDDTLIEGILQLKRQGYTIALDDFIFHEKLRPLIELASIIKVDILAMDDVELRTHAYMLKQYSVKLLAEKVETKAQFDYCKELGFHYFQGYFFCKPDIIEDKPLPENQLKLLQLIEKLQNPDVEFKEVETLISQEASLSYKLVRLLNSASFGLNRQVESIHEAVILLGLKAIKTWTTLILMSGVEFTTPILIEHTLIRAKMGEKLAKHYQITPDTGFILGLFSTLDVVFSRPMETLLAQIPITDSMKLALISQQGLMGQMLKTVIDYEQGRWDDVNEDFVSMETLSEHYVEATAWMIDTHSFL
jgi:EAL and modified HD-GYP domain-containing signal transduction protein